MLAEARAEAAEASPARQNARLRAMIADVREEVADAEKQHAAELAWRDSAILEFEGALAAKEQQHAQLRAEVDSLVSEAALARGASDSTDRSAWVPQREGVPQYHI